MSWIIIIIVLLIIGAMLDSTLGKIIITAGVLAIACLIISKLLEITFFVTLAKICGVVIVIAIVGSILKAIFG